ncbi:MAG: ATP-binding protein [Methanomassiliicoccales archaeon]|jgi:hypothetical protein|nr:ATP-binding protein [Methanomassiliicoccales archaeon]
MVFKEDPWSWGSMRSVDITPDKSLIEKLGSVGFTPEEAISEFIDNALDAKYDNVSGSEIIPGKITVTIDLNHDSIEIRDTSAGILDFDNCLKAARSDKISGNTLGSFGLGLKTASMSLGRRLFIESKRIHEPIGHRTVLDIDEWKETSDWIIKVEDFDAPVSDHYTHIKIDRLHVDPLLYEEELIDGLAERFDAFLEEDVLEININGKTITPEKRIFLSEDDPSLINAIESTGLKNFKKRKVFKFNIGSMSISGWVDLLEKRSMSSKFGFHLYRGRRLITGYEKIGIRDHPSHANIFGHIYLPIDFPVSFTKNKVEVQRKEYKMLKDKMKEITSDHTRISSFMAQEKAPVVEPKVDKDLKKSLDVLTEALKECPALSGIFPEERRRALEREAHGFGEVPSETRRPPINETATRPVPKNSRARNPAKDKPKQLKDFWFVNLDGFKLKLYHDWIEIDEPRMWYSNLDQSDKIPELTVETNVSFEAYKLTTDKVFYATSNVIMALSRVVMSLADPSKLGNRDIVDLSEEIYLAWGRKIKSKIKESE